jgi:hypothetical protein
MDFLAVDPGFNTLSIADLLHAREQFHPHLMHKAHVIGTAIGRYLIRESDPYPSARDELPRRQRPPAPPRGRKGPRTLENSSVRSYSWPCLLVFVDRWLEEDRFGGSAGLASSDFVPKAIYLEDGRRVPLCVVLAQPVESAPDPPAASRALAFDGASFQGGYPLIVDTQGERRVGSAGCLVTDGHVVYVLTNRHVAGRPGETLYIDVDGREVAIGRASDKRLGRLPFEQVYAPWAGRQVYVNLDVALVELTDVRQWAPAIAGIGVLGPLADLSVFNLGLNLIGCPVRAHGAASGNLSGRIAALFYRYKSVGGFEYVADFLIGSRDETPLQTAPGDSGTVWVVETGEPGRDRLPIAVQWGGTVFMGEEADFPFALATNLSTVCRELEVDLFRSRELPTFEYWGRLGHHSVGAFACDLVTDPTLGQFLRENRARIGLAIGSHTPAGEKLANVPDDVWKGFSAPGRSPNENSTHYADIDLVFGAATKSLDMLTPTADDLDPATWRAYYDSIHWTEVRQRGMLPFRVWQIYRQLVALALVRNAKAFLAAAGIFAHYIGDACQPLHGSYLDDGDPFRNPDGTPTPQHEMLGHGRGYGGGVHKAYETNMLDDNVGALLKRLPKRLPSSHGMPHVTGGRQAGFAALELMRRSRQRLLPMDIVEVYGKLKKDRKTRGASQVLWTKFGDATVDVIVDGCRTLAMLWESAWIEGSGAQIPETDLRQYSLGQLRPIYTPVGFLPSVPLDQIDPHL